MKRYLSDKPRWYESRYLNLYLFLALIIMSFYSGYSMERNKETIRMQEQ